MSPLTQGLNYRSACDYVSDRVMPNTPPTRLNSTVESHRRRWFVLGLKCTNANVICKYYLLQKTYVVFT